MAVVADVLPAKIAPAAPSTASPAVVPPKTHLPAGDWPALLQEIAACRACSLCEQRKQAVPGIGDLQPDWLFIGEGPGAEEDVRGEPFVGQAGKLLDAMLDALDIARGNKVYIANAVKCRPPGNRTPEAAEMAACRPYLERQIALLKPKIIVLLGKAAVHSVLHDDKSLASLRGHSRADLDAYSAHSHRRAARALHDRQPHPTEAHDEHRGALLDLRGVEHRAHVAEHVAEAGADDAAARRLRRKLVLPAAAGPTRATHTSSSSACTPSVMASRPLSRVAERSD